MAMPGQVMVRNLVEGGSGAKVGGHEDQRGWTRRHGGQEVLVLGPSVDPDLDGDIAEAPGPARR